MKKSFVIFVGVVLSIVLMVACSTKTETQIVEVTRLVQEPVTQVVTVEVVHSEEVTQPIEVTRQVEVTRLVEVTQQVEATVVKEVTREVTATPEPSEYEQVYQFSGTGNGTTQAFTFKPGEWRIYWECASPAPNGFSIYLKAPGTTYGVYVARIIASGNGFTDLSTTANTDTSMQFVFDVKADYDWVITLGFKP